MRGLVSYLAVPVCSAVKGVRVWRCCLGTYHVVLHPGCYYHLHVSLFLPTTRSSSCPFFLVSSPAPSHDTHSADPVKVEVALGKCPCNVSVVLGCICAPLILNSQVWLTHSSQGWVLQLHWLSQSKLTQSKWSEKIQEKWQTFSELIFMYLCTNFHRRQSLIAKWRNVDQWRDNQAKHQRAKHLLPTGRMNSTHPAWTVRHELISSFWNNTINFTLSHRDICIPNRHSHIKFSNNYNKTFMTIKYGAIKQR